MSEFMDYRFTDTARTVEGVREQLHKFRQTLTAFGESYRKLANRWGGTASLNAEKRAKDIDQLGNETEAIVDKFLTAYEGHYFDSRRTENQIADELA
jgi:hypothetical protein